MDSSQRLASSIEKGRNPIMAIVQKKQGRTKNAISNECE